MFDMPTLQEKIDAIRAECIRCNPEIVELKMTCQVELESEDECYQKATIWRRLSDDSSECEWGSFGPSFITKILGRPIRLADVLAAMNGKGNYCINTEGFFFDPHVVYTRKWDLLHDNLEQQTDQTVAFIHQVLFGV